MGAPLGYPPQNYWMPPAPPANAWGPPGGGYPGNPADMYGYGGPPADMYGPGPAPQGGGPGGMSQQEMAQLIALAQSMGIPPEALGLPGGGGGMPGMPGAPGGSQPVRGLVMKPDPNNPNSPGTVWDTGSSSGMGFFTKVLILGLLVGGGVLAFKKWGNAEMISKATAFIKEHTPQKLKDGYRAVADKIGGLFGKGGQAAEKAAEKAAT